MRVFFFVVVLVITLGFLGFMATNPDTRVSVQVLRTVHEDVRLWTVVFVTLVVTAVLIGSFAMAEGSSVRLENRRLRREVHKLETEINYLRTQPSAASRPGDVEVSNPPRPGPSREGGGEDAVPSAPVYGEDGDRWPSDTDDDAYSGGRAV